MNLKKCLVPLILSALLLCSCGSSVEAGSKADATPHTTNKLTVEDNIDLSYVKDTSAAGLFKQFLTDKAPATFNNEKVFLGDLLNQSFDEDSYDSGSQTIAEYLAENFAISYVVSEAKEPTLYLEIMNVMVEGAIYQIRIKDGGLYVNSNLDTGWSDSLSVYPNGMVGMYHGMHLPALEYYYDATDKLIDVVSGEGKAKLLIFGPKSYFEGDFDQALADYQEMADTVLAFEEDAVAEFGSQRDEVLKLSADNDVIDWNRVTVTNFER